MGRRDERADGASPGAKSSPDPKELPHVGVSAGEGPADRLAELEHLGVRDRVARPVPLLPLPDDASPQEEAEMLGDVLLRGPELACQLLDRCLAGTQVVKQSDPHRLPEEPKALGDQLRELGRDRMRQLGCCCCFGAHASMLPVS